MDSKARRCSSRTSWDSPARLHQGEFRCVRELWNMARAAVGTRSMVRRQAHPGLRSTVDCYIILHRRSRIPHREGSDVGNHFFGTAWARVMHVEFVAHRQSLQPFLKHPHP